MSVCKTKRGIDPSIYTVVTGTSGKTSGEMMPLINRAVQHPNYRKTVIFDIFMHYNLYNKT